MIEKAGSIVRALLLLGLGYLAGLGIGAVCADQRALENRQALARASTSNQGEPAQRPLAPQADEGPRAPALPTTITFQNSPGLAELLFAASLPPASFVQAAEPVPQAELDPVSAPAQVPEAIPAPISAQGSPPAEEYRVGIDDILDINILQPEALAMTVTVGPDGLISFPFIGSVSVKGLTVSQIQAEVQSRLADGYMKYPVVTASLKESRSRKFFVYGEVIRPGPYAIEEHTTVLRGISMAGGFTKYGSSSRVKLLRPHADSPGYQTLKINMKSVMAGNSENDLSIQPGDIIVVSEGMF